MRNPFILIFVLFLTLNSCGNDVLVKPEAKLRLEYPLANYVNTNIPCNYEFKINTLTQLIPRKDCWINVVYPSINATIFITYRQIQNNLDSLLYDAQKLTYDHTVKAQNILEQPRVDSINNVYGMLYMINGDAATQSQFYVTDNQKHFITGSVYFNAKPNFDSIYPAVDYLRNDVRRIMETINWKN